MLIGSRSSYIVLANVQYLITGMFVFQKLKQHLQRTKQGNKSSQTYGRQSPLHGDHTAIAASRLPQSIPISIPLAPRQSEGPQKRSLEGLNSEIQKLVLTDTQSDRVSITIMEQFGGELFFFNFISNFREKNNCT